MKALNVIGAFWSIFLSQLDGHWLLVKLSIVSYQQQSYSGPNSPKRSYSTYSWNDSWVQTFHSYTSYFYLARVNHIQGNYFDIFSSSYFLLDKLFHFILELKILFPLKMY